MAFWRLETHSVREKPYHYSTTQQEYLALAKQLCPNIQVEFVAKSEIDQQFAFLDAKWEGVMAVSQTHRVCGQASGANDIKVAVTSNKTEKCFQVCRIRNTNVTPPTNSSNEQNSPIEDDAQPQLPALDLTIVLWVTVKYEGEVFPGEVTCIEDSDVEVNVMHTRANAWKWPRPEDKIFYSRNKIERVINRPSVADN